MSTDSIFGLGRLIAKMKRWLLHHLRKQNTATKNLARASASEGSAASRGQKGSEQPLRGITAIICGQIRDVAEFNLIADTVVRAKLDGTIDRVIFSTWFEDQYSFAEQIDRVRTLGWEVLLSNRTQVPQCQPNQGHVSYQKTNLRAGLSCVEDDAWVLKIRTDKCLQTLQEFLQRLRQPPSFRVRQVHLKDQIFSHKIMIRASWCLVPFYIDDLVFFGKAKDLFFLTDLNLLYTGVESNVIAEQLWFSPPFTARSRELSRSISSVHWIQVVKALRAGAADLKQVDTQYPGAARALALWLACLDEWFVFCHSEVKLTRRISFADFAGFKASIGGDVEMHGLGVNETYTGIMTGSCLTSLLTDRYVQTESCHLFQKELDYCRKIGLLGKIPTSIDTKI